MLENGDLIFVKDESDIGQAIQESTGNYSHVAIFLDGQVYHAITEGGVLAQSPEDFFEAEKVYDLYLYPKMDQKAGREPFRDSLQFLFLSRRRWLLLFPVCSRHSTYF